jgi:hypothetical protein
VRLLFGAWLVVAVAAFAAAQSQPSQTPPDSQPAQTTTVLDVPPTTDTESPLVRAARLARANRKIPKKVLTNADVKNSKGKLAVTSAPPPATDTAPKPNVDKRTSLEKQDAQYHTRQALQERVTADQKKVDSLERDLASIEQSYYEEKDLNRRDDVIQKRFSQTKRQLEDARKDLADTRDALSALSLQP